MHVYERIAAKTMTLSKDETEEWAVRAGSVLTVLVSLIEDDAVQKEQVVDAMETLLARMNAPLLEASFHKIAESRAALALAREGRDL